MTTPQPDLIAVTITDATSLPGAAWMESETFRFPGSVVRESRVLEPDGAGWKLTGTLLDDGAAPKDLRLLRTFVTQKPASSRLPFSYQRIPPAIRSLVARIIGRRKRRCVDQWACFPGWPLDLSADALADLAGESGPYAGKPTPVILTHDLDSLEGVRNLHALFLDLEERHGARSYSYVVPTLSLDMSMLADIASRGHGLGIHGCDHSNLTPFCTLPEIEERLGQAREIMDRFGPCGYRAPSLLRTPDLLQGLAGDFAHDSSVPTAGGLFPVPNNGCASARPFLLEGVPELPLSMPRDGSLRFLGYKPTEILNIWKECAERIGASGGVVVLLNHCEKRFSGNPPMLAAYDGFLEYVAASDRFTWAMPEDVLAPVHGQ